MSAGRKKLFDDDPLFTNDDKDGSNAIDTKSIYDDDSSIMPLDTSKVNLKTKVNKETSKVNPAESVFGQDLWSNSLPTISQVDILASVGSSKDSSNDDGLFSSSGSKSNNSGSDMSGYYDKLSTKQQLSSPAKSKLIINDMNDDNLSDLSINRMLEKEDDLDFETFGKKSITQGSAVTKSTTTTTTTIKTIPTSTTDDFISASNDVLRIIESSSSISDVPTHTQSSRRVATEVNIPVEVDISSIDLNSYVSSQQSSSGGLFD